MGKYLKVPEHRISLLGLAGVTVLTRRYEQLVIVHGRNAVLTLTEHDDEQWEEIKAYLKKMNYAPVEED